MSVQSEQILRRMWQTGGVVVRERGANILSIHPRGDRRRRPVGWIDALDARDWERKGMLTLTSRGLELSDTVRERLRSGQSPREVEAALDALHAEAEARQSVVMPQVETFDRLCDAHGKPVFTPAQIEAARRFHRDLRRAGQADGVGPAASDLAAPQVDGTRRHDRVEDAAIARLDAGRAVARAKRGLDRRVAGVLTRVIAADEPLASVETAQGLTPGVGAMLMQIGLDHLVRHYRVRTRP